MSQRICKARGKTVYWNCKRASEPGSQYCFWHDPDRPKNRVDIQTRKAEIDVIGDVKVEGTVVFGLELQEADLSNLKLVEARFGDGKPTNLRMANFSNTDLWRAEFRGSPNVVLDLSSANFRNANLLETLFEDASLDGADFSNAVLKSTTFKRTSMKGILLGDAHRLDNLEFNDVTWEVGKVNIYEQRKEWKRAQRVYATVKQAYNRQGDQKTAAEFFYREMECRRKGAKKILERIGYTFLFLFWGYGERPFRTLGVVVARILFFAALLTIIDPTMGFPYYLYFSVVSFTLGYGSWGVTPAEPIRILAILEAIFGVPMTGSFLVTLTRKMVR